MFSSPNMKDINDANISFWSPHPFSIAGFFAPQQLFQLAWLYRLYRLTSSSPSALSATQKRDVGDMVDYVPYYAVGNACIATWMLFWNQEMLKTSNVLVVINSLTQLYYVFGRQSSMDKGSWDSILTHIVSKTFAGIGVLDLLHNGSVAYFKDVPATSTVKIVTALGFGLGSAVSDWIFGGCLVYDLVGLSIGQASAGNKGWSQLLGAYAVGAAAIVAGKNLAR